MAGDYRTLSADAHADLPVSPAAEWLLDNSYLIDEQVRHLLDAYPPHYAAELPRLDEGPYASWPRLFEAAVTLVAHTDSHLEIGALERFIVSYQTVSPLTMGEVWSVPTLLRVALVENLRRLSRRVLAAHNSAFEADSLADALLVAADVGPREVASCVAGLPANPSAPFVVRLLQRMAAGDLALTPISSWLNGVLERRGESLDELTQATQQEQAADQLSVANSITSLRMIEAADWRAFFERVSLVERTLRTDPVGVYRDMDFASRDRYRHAVEGLAKGCRLDEIAIAEAVVEQARASLGRYPADTAKGHVGYYLVSDGRLEFERAIRYRPRLSQQIRRGPLVARGIAYWSLLAGLTVGLAALLAWYVAARTDSAWVTGATMLLALLPISEVAWVIVRRVASWVWRPRLMPRFDPRLPVPPAHRTLVVYTTLLGSPDAARRVIETMEVGYLGNVDPNVRFAVLADLPGAATEHAPTDGEVLEAAGEGVRRLNERYGAPGEQPFGLFVRRRTWNERDQLWMGHERKRGALEDMVAALRGSGRDRFSLFVAERDHLSGTTFVITLDADTALPRDTARTLIATIAHPLNRAVVDGSRRVVRRGYGLIQPRVAMSLESAEATLFARLYSGATGIDPYAGAVSDTYQDVFGEGSFTGKGIFDVDAYYAVLSGRLPEDLLLSHDLLEGSYLRTGLASDIEVLDDQPGNYLSHCARLHRWTRGDWQTLPWLLPWVPCSNGKERNPLLRVHRFKIADNLRRSLVPVATLALVIWGFWVLPTGMWGWLALMTALPLFSIVVGLIDSAIFGRGPSGTRRDRSISLADLARDLLRALLDTAALPHSAQQSVDASVRACWRLIFSHRRMLEWETAAESEKRLGKASVRAFSRRMAPVGVLAASVVFLCLLGPGGVAAGVAAAPFALAWLASPWLAWRLSQPRTEPKPALTAADQVAVRRVARMTWRFFERFVGADDHYLAPDNYQEDPKGEVAHRTSPTNIGLQLIATVTAYDLGFIGVDDLVRRTSQTLTTLTRMERFRGHFYNWYDTRTLQPLRPAYISTVDSGNLAGHLLTLRAALEGVPALPLVHPESLEAIADAARLALEDLRAATDGTTGAATASAATSGTELRAALEEIVRYTGLHARPVTLAAWVTALERLAALGDPLPALAEVGQPDLRSSLDDLIRAIHAPLRLIALDPSDRHSRAVGLQEARRPHGAGAKDEERGVPTLAEIAAAPGSPGSAAAHALLGEVERCIDVATALWEQMDFSVLFDPDRMLFSIGFNTAEGRLDDSYYDLLASECRLTSFLAIARGDVPQEHWFHLGREITRTDAGPALVSWSASMFEYLMPMLVMRAWPNTLLHRTCTNVVRRQLQYGRQRGVPWGVSESAFNAKDAELTYQYQAFGVPGLGLKRNLSADLVVAPYASVLAMMVAPRDALDNLGSLAEQGAEGRFGLYEAIDYTPGRVPAGRERAVVKTYMAHHQGMSLVALGNVLTDFRMQQRFHSEPLVTSVELLLQERIPRHTQVMQPRAEEVEFVRTLRETPQPRTRAYPTADTAVPATHFLSNGTYSVMITNAGGGYSRWRDRSVTRYREDITRDCWGTFIYIRDIVSSDVWSAAFQPTRSVPDDYHAIFSADKAEFRRSDHGIETHTEVIVSPEDDVEVRRVTITNHRHTPFAFDLTSYLEVTLAPRGADHAHKAFSNLFVETEPLPTARAVLFTRRPRSASEPRVWGMHLLACDGSGERPFSYETNRAAFLGRLRTPANPIALESTEPLEDTSGAVLDPVCSVRTRLDLAPGESARVAFVTGAADSRAEIVRLAEKYHDIASAQRAADLAWSTSRIELRDLGITPEESVTMLRLASRLLLTDPHSHLKPLTKFENRLPLSALWSLGISGDYPILLVKIERLEETPLVRHMLLAHQYWRTKGFACDLVILNTRPSAYSSELDARLATLMRTGHALQLADRAGGIHLRVADHIPPDVLVLLESVARVVLLGDAGPVDIQLNRRATYPEAPPQLVPTRAARYREPVRLERPPLAFFNGYGGFDFDSGEYVIVLEDTQSTPATWANVIAHPHFGALVSEAGVGCSWAENSHENRITTWNNDPVSDGTGECFYIRDEETGEFWSPTQLPMRGAGTYIVRHGHGYTRFEHTTHGIAHALDWFVSASAPVRVARLRLTNQGAEPRRLTVTHFVEWVLGDSRSAAQQRVVTWWDHAEEMLMAHSWFNADFPGRPAFLAWGEVTPSAPDWPSSYTASRTEFIGRNGVPHAPAAMSRERLGGESGRFHDNCGALMREVRLEPGGSAEVAVLLGQAESVATAHALVRRLSEPGSTEKELEAARASWRRDLRVIEVSTPDPALDVIVNGPALYQSLACRFWGRTATYQSSGAFGFRDQLQDCLALLEARPDLVREHIIEASRRQFPEGDVLHWWQPVTGRGVRTRFADDRHWLPFVVAEYVRTTGDLSLLAEETPYLEGPPVPEEREDLYMRPHPSRAVGTIYEHCLSALDLAPLGRHGLPLMGGGDWNDGMNRVGAGGAGESVWLAWFLDVVFRAFAEVCERAADDSAAYPGALERASSLRERAASLVAAIERSSWDGAWYRRAFFDDGTPLGTADASECRIDSIAQAWAVISGSGDPQRARMAMASVDELLVDEEEGLVRLLAPPFDRMEHDPGYVKGYVPGVRENGGQYTHAAVWAALAFARLGEAGRAVALMDLVNPVNHSLDAASAKHYAVEPYAIAADVCSVEPHIGHGGWTWYTGAAAWFYRVAVRDILGLRTEADTSPPPSAAPSDTLQERPPTGPRVLVIEPCVPPDWPMYSAVYRVGSTTYHITVQNPSGTGKGVAGATLDGASAIHETRAVRLPIVDDGRVHEVAVTLGAE